MGFNLVNLSQILKLLKFLPLNFDLVPRVLSTFNNLYVDNLDDTIYSLIGFRVHELRGQKYNMTLTENKSRELINLAGTISNNNTVLSTLYEEYIHYKSNRRKGQKPFKDFQHYYSHSLENETKIIQLQVKVNLYCAVYFL